MREQRKRRRRRRSIGEVQVPSEGPSATLRELAAKFYRANKDANQLSSQARKLKVQLMDRMAEEGVESFSDLDTALTTSLQTPKRQVVDVEVLRKHVDEETFLAVVSASQTKVRDMLGQTILNQCLKPTEGTPSVKVEETK